MLFRLTVPLVPYFPDQNPVVFKAGVVSKTIPNFTRLDPGRPEIAILLDAMLRAREVVAARSWSTSQEPTSEHWWADVLADPRARQRQVSRGLHSYSGGKIVERAYYTLADEPGSNNAGRVQQMSLASSVQSRRANHQLWGGIPVTEFARSSCNAGLLEN